MILYHGSSVGGITELKPFLSEHKKEYVYLTSNPVVALLYTVKSVPKPFSFYPYGFNGEKLYTASITKIALKTYTKVKKDFYIIVRMLKMQKTPQQLTVSILAKRRLK